MANPRRRARVVASPSPTRRKGPAPTLADIDMTQVRAVPSWIDVSEVKPYEYNARDNSKAIAAVRQSIKTFGFIVPIVIDDDGNLAAGHTRMEAVKELGMGEVLALRASHLTTEQIDAFRLIDNKVAEIAEWDTDLLAQEVNRLNGMFDFTEFGWNQDEIDCMTQLVASDCLSVEGLSTPPATEEEDEENRSIAGRRGPQSTRLVIGELVLFVPTADYRNWVDGLRRLHNFDNSEIEADILNRLGIHR